MARPRGNASYRGRHRRGSDDDMKRRWLILGAIASVVFGGIIYVTVAELH